MLTLDNALVLLRTTPDTRILCQYPAAVCRTGLVENPSHRAETVRGIDPPMAMLALSLLPADALDPGALPLSATITLLALLLMLAGILALGLSWALWRQRQRLRQTAEQLQLQTLALERQRADADRAHVVERNLRDVATQLPVLVCAAHRDGAGETRLDFLAGDLHRLLGVDARQAPQADAVLRDWPLLDRVHPEDRDRLRQHLRRTLRHARVDTLDFRAYGAEGLRWLHLAMASQRRAGGGIAWAGYVIDHTQVASRSQALRSARDAAERASRAKADFLATMSHEIRTPMNGVIGMLELLGRTPLDADQSELLHAVEDSAGVLLQILNDVLDFSKLEAGNLRLDPAPFDPRTLVDNVVGLTAGALRRKGLDVAVSMDATLAGRLLGDDMRLRQILLNLLNNAGKFTERGHVAVALRVLDDDDQRQSLRLSVTDTGVGIPADRQAALFTPFTQAESWTARRHGGTGLGLAICKYLVQLMDGNIELDSSEDRGTTVTATLRLPVAQRDIERPAGVAGHRAVVRLPDAGLASALGAHLEALGLSVEFVPPTQPLRPGIAADFLFVDAGDHDSALEIAARVVAASSSLDAFAQPRVDGERVLLGTNPLKWQAVARACALALQPPSDGAADVPAAMLPAARVAPPQNARARTNEDAARILVAEDHPVNRALAQRQLALLGWPCDVVADGNAALQALRSRDYALLMTDCQMPGMDGYELAAAWRGIEAAQARAQRLPIIAMTAHALGSEAARCREAGMDDHLGKPVQLRALEEKLLAWLPPPDTQAAITPTPADQRPALHGDMLSLLLDTSHADLDAIDQAALRGDASAAARRLHRLLGALQIFVADAAIDQASQLLDELGGDRSAAALQRLPARLAGLRGLIERMRPGAAAGTARSAKA
jgi:signal transduction histidine kinase/DNA-binding response OmpR family regulator